MSWFKVDDQIAFHAKTVAAGNEAFGAWTRMGAYASGYRTNGFVSEEVALTIAGGKRAVLVKLTKVRFLDSAEGGYQIHDFLEVNPNADGVLAVREATREARRAAGKIGGLKSGQVRRERAGDQPEPRSNCFDAGKQNEANGEANDRAKSEQNEPPSPSPYQEETIPPGVPEANRSTEPKLTAPSAPALAPTAVLPEGAYDLPRPRSAPGAFGVEAGAWVEGLRQVTGKPHTMPHGGDFRRLVDAIATHCPPDTDRCAYARTKAMEWARSKPRSITVFKFVDWLDSGSPAQALPALLRPQRAVQPFNPDSPWLKTGGANGGV